MMTYFYAYILNMDKSYQSNNCIGCLSLVSSYVSSLWSGWENETNPHWTATNMPV